MSGTQYHSELVNLFSMIEIHDIVDSKTLKFQFIIFILILHDFHGCITCYYS